HSTSRSISFAIRSRSPRTTPARDASSAFIRSTISRLEATSIRSVLRLRCSVLRGSWKSGLDMKGGVKLDVDRGSGQLPDYEMRNILALFAATLTLSCGVSRAAAVEVLTLDYREAAPAGATHDMYLDPAGNPTDKSLVGHLAAGVPGSVAGLYAAWKRLGSLPWPSLLAPAIRLANGHVVDSARSRDITN